MNDLNLTTLAPIYSEIVTPVVWWPYVAGLGGVLLLVALILFGVQRRRTGCTDAPVSIRGQLEALDFTAEPTEALYRFSLLMQSLPESQRPEDLPLLLRELAPYKYAPAPPPISEELLTQIHRMIEEVVV